MIEYNEMVKMINEMSDNDLDKLIENDECPFRPEIMPKSISMGMFHCQVCGEMVISGIPHPRYKNIK